MVCGPGLGCEGGHRALLISTAGVLQLVWSAVCRAALSVMVFAGTKWPYCSLSSV